MKQNLTLISILLSIWSLSYTQNCIPGTIVFTTQTQVDSFPQKYPGCTIIDGNVGITGDNITNLDSLKQITEIKSSIQVLDATNLMNIGLNNLTKIGGSFIIKNLNNLLNFNSLVNLDSIGGSFELESLNISNLLGLNNLKKIHGNFKVYYLTSIQNFGGLNSLKSIGGNFELGAVNSLNNFSGLLALDSIGGDFIFTGSSINNFNGLNNLKKIYSYPQKSDSKLNKFFYTKFAVYDKEKINISI